MVTASAYAVLIGIVCTTSCAFLDLLTMLDCRLTIVCATLRPSLPACQASNCNMRLQALLAKAQELCLISTHEDVASA